MQVIDGISYSVSAGDAIFLAPNEHHSYYSSTDMKIINCCFSSTAFSDFKHIAEKCDKTVTLSTEDRASFKLIISLLEGEIKRNKDSFAVSKSYLSAICSILLRNNKGAKIPSFWQPLISDIAASYSDITLDAAAKKAHLSKNYFCRRFKKDFGVTFNEYISHLKIQSGDF